MGCRGKHKNNTGGYTLIEAIIALGIFMMIAVFSVNMLGIAAKVSARLTVGAELLENARIGLDVIIAHVREAESIELTADTVTDTLEELIVGVRKYDGVHYYKFTYNSALVYGQARFHRIDFGGNELASHINDVQMKIDKGVLRIAITTDGNVGSGLPVIVEPVVLRAKVSLKYKIVKP